MIITHVVTFLIYLLSVINYYIFYLIWNGETSNARLTNATFFFWTLSVVLQGMAQLILIYIFWGITAPNVDLNDSYLSSPEKN